jgi:hypothetical protein
MQINVELFFGLCPLATALARPQHSCGTYYFTHHRRFYESIMCKHLKINKIGKEAPQYFAVKRWK